MKNFSLLLLIGSVFFLTGCETTREITFTDNNSGTVVTTTDMSAMIGMAKMTGQSKEMDKLSEEKIDTTISLSNIADSLEGISPDDKALVKKGKLYMQMNLPDEKFLVKVELPFSDPEQIGRLDALSKKMMQVTFKKLMAQNQSGDSSLMGGNDIPDGSVDDYFDVTYAKGLIEKKLNKEKYAKAENDESLKAMKEMSGSGIGNSTLIINLPRPVKKAEGKNVKLSDDKKKVIISTSMEDFFDDASSLEFRIEY